ncbi:MAG: helix-turn-helix transcriptional regulator [Armatimonadota bacterium]|nr:helix-turn-helix transcriptional regulator [Armatimonadota bacterium]
MKKSREYQERKERFESDPDYILHGLLYDIAEDIYAAMEERGWSQAELARKAAMKPSFLSRFLNTPSNTELRTIVRLAVALGLRYEHRFTPEKGTMRAAREDIAGRVQEKIDVMRASLGLAPGERWEPGEYMQPGVPAHALDEEEDGDDDPELDAVA